MLSGTLTIKTHVKPEGTDPRLTLCLMQDSIIAVQTNGSSAYAHRHVFRGCLNGTWGESIDLEEGKELTKEISYTLPDSIQSTYYHVNIKAIPEHMYLVAFVSNYNPDDVTDRNVYNCTETRFVKNTSTSGIADITENRAKARLLGTSSCVMADGDFDSLYIYDLNGKMVRKCTKQGETFTLTPGVYVTKAVKDGKATTAKSVIAR